MRDGYEIGGNPPYEATGARREIDLFDLAAFAWSQKLFILIAFLALFLPMAAGAWFMLKPSYEVESRLLVLLDANNPTPGAAGAGEPFTLDQVLVSESEILNSNAVRRRALERLGGDTDAGAVRGLADGFAVDRSPNASLLTATYEGADPQEAADTLNAIVDGYLDYRQELLVDAAAGGLTRRLESAEEAAAQADRALQDFLEAEGISDFEAERAAASERVNDLRAQLLAARASAASARGGADALAARLASIPQAVELYVESDASGQLLNLQIRRQELISRYQEDAPPVVAIDREIAAVREFLDSGAAEGSGQRRSGANPVHQDLDTQRLEYEATAQSQANLAEALEAQLADARAESDRLRALAPAYGRLAREARSRAEAAEMMSSQSASAALRAGAATGTADAVRIVERAAAPSAGSSMRMLAIAAAVVLAFGAALVLGLLKGYVAAVHPDGFDRMFGRTPAHAPRRAPAGGGVRPPLPANQAAPAAQTAPEPARTVKPLEVLARVRDHAAPVPAAAGAR